MRPNEMEPGEEELETMKDPAGEGLLTDEEIHQIRKRAYDDGISPLVTEGAIVNLCQMVAKAQAALTAGQMIEEIEEHFPLSKRSGWWQSLKSRYGGTKNG